MKNYLIFALSLAVLVLGYLLFKKNAVAPSRGEEGMGEVTETPKEESPKAIFDKEENKVFTENEETLDVKIEYPSFGNKKIDDEIKNYIMANLSQFKAENDLSYPNSTLKNNYTARYRVERSEKLTSIIFSISQYTGGAHDNLIIKTLNYDNSGNKVVIGSLFKPESDYLSELSEISRRKLKEKLKENLAAWSDDGTAPTTENFGSFYVKDENTLVIIFQPYQVAPWAAGTPEISIDMESELSGIINEEFLN